jgi:hypothetical protein
VIAGTAVLENYLPSPCRHFIMSLNAVHQFVLFEYIGGLDWGSTLIEKNGKIRQEMPL